jgi:hypothetical protein
MKVIKTAHIAEIYRKFPDCSNSKLAEELNKIVEESINTVLAEDYKIEYIDSGGWIDSTSFVFGEPPYNYNNIEVKFDDGSICKYLDEWPIAIATHLRKINNEIL